MKFTEIITFSLLNDNQMSTVLHVQFLIYDTSLFYFSVKSLFYLFWLFNVYFLENGLYLNTKICNKIISVTYIATSLVRRHFNLIVLST